MSMNPGDLGGGSGGINEWIQDHKGATIGIGAGALVLFYLYMKKKSASAASSSTTGYSTGSQAPVYLVGTNPNSPSNTSVSGQGVSASQLFSQLQNQQSIIDSYLAGSLPGGVSALPGQNYPSSSMYNTLGVYPAPNTLGIPVGSTGGTTNQNTSLGQQTQSWIPPNPNIINPKTAAPGETAFVSSAYDPQTNLVYSLTNDGGVYSTNPTTGGMAGGPFFGSAFSIGQGGNNLFSQGNISINPNGGYTLTNNQGQTFSFA